MVKIKYFSVSLFIIFTILLASYKNVFPQSIGIQEAREISRKSQELIEQKKWTEAIKILQEGIQRCSNDEKAKEYRAIINFSLGYLYQLWADEDITKKTNYLKKSIELYKLALNGFPNKIQILNNLAIVHKRLRQWQSVIEVLKEIIEIDREKHNTYYIALGDIYREIKNSEEAFKNYRKASELNPIDKSPHWRILSLYRRLSDDEIENKIKDLFKYAINLKKLGQYELAKNGFEQVINRSYQSNTPLAEKTLILWAELGATKGWISEESLQSLPNEDKWDSSAIKELRRLLKNPKKTRLKWWVSDEYQSYVAASVMKALGNHFLMRGKFIDSENIFDLAHEAAPKNHPFIILDIKSELASLYHKYPSLDPQGRKLRALIGSLFIGKGEAYERGDLDAIQRYHTILGLIYSERGQWWTSEGQADNAIFQLKYALNTAWRRARKDDKNFQPLPHLQSLLAKGYSIERRKKEAFSTYVDAAIGYLDLDSLEKSEEMIRKANTFFNEVNARARKKLKETKKILKSRQRIPDLQRKNIVSTSVEYFGKMGNFNWLYDPNNLSLNKSFLGRQRFKAFADLGNLASKLEAHQEALRLQTHAMEIIKKENILTNMDDIIRLEKIKTSVLQLIHLKSSKQTIGTSQNLKKDSNYKNGKIWWMQSPSEPYPMQVGISSDLLLATTIANRISIEPSVASELLTIQLQEGIVTILEEQSSPEIIKRADEFLKNIEGVKHVAIKKERRELILE